uniref:Vacuolar protein sorting 55 n=1 Tax=Parascaris univalens TaxID=6257 RepID=A0A915BDI2_PARUN
MCIVTTMVAVSVSRSSNVVAYPTSSYIIFRLRISSVSYFFIFLANIVCFGAVLAYFKVFNEEEMNEMSLW